MEKHIKNYALYTDEDQKELLAMAYSKEQFKEVSLNYTGGTWFEYDVEIREGHLDILYNERLYTGQSKFTKEIVKEKEEEKLGLNSSVGDLRN